MKVMMFHLMSHRQLPGDFEQRYNSVWVDPPFHELATPDQYVGFYHDSLDELLYAAERGMDGVCLNEHHQNAYGGTPAPNMFGGILARATRGMDVAIVQMGSTLPTTIPPLRVAEEYAMLDVLSEGRLVAGMPIGTPMDVTLCYGVTPQEQRERFYEAHDLILDAWTRDDIFAWNGKYFQLPMVNLWPRPVQQPHPPVWIPGISSVSTMEFVARHDHAYCVLSAFAGSEGIGGAAKIAESFWDFVDQQNGEMNPFRLGMALPVVVADSEADAERLYGDHIRYFWTKLTHIAPEYWGVPGHHDYRSLLNTVKQFGTTKITESMGDWSMGKFFERQVIIGGDGAAVTEQLRDLAKRMRFGHLMVLLQFGSMPSEIARQNIDRFCTDVLPNLRDLFEDEFDDRWWPEKLGGKRGGGRTPVEQGARA